MKQKRRSEIQHHGARVLRTLALQASALVLLLSNPTFSSASTPPRSPLPDDINAAGGTCGTWTCENQGNMQIQTEKYGASSRTDASEYGKASIDFIDLDGDAVVAPFRFQALNIDEVANATIVVMVMIDGQQHVEMLLDGTKKISVGFSMAELLPPGTYTATLLLSDAAGHWDGDHFSYPGPISLLGVDSPARKLVVQSDKRAFTKHAAFMTAQERCTQDLSILIALESSQVDDLLSLADRWHGPISAAVFISTADQAQPVLREGGHEIDTILRLRSLHAWATEHTGSCLTISLLFETTPSASWTAPYHMLYNMAISQVRTTFILSVEPGRFPSISLATLSREGLALMELMESPSSSPPPVALILPLLLVHCPPRLSENDERLGSGRGAAAVSGGGGGKGGAGAGAVAGGGGDWLADVADGSECGLPDGSDLHAAVQEWKGAAGGVSEGGTVGVGGGGAVAWQLELPDGADKLEWRGGGEGASGVTLDADTPAHLLLRREHAALLDEDATHQQHLLHAVTNIWASRGHRLAVAHGVYLYTLAPYPPPRPTA